MLDTYNKWNIVTFSTKSSLVEEFDEIQKVMICGIIKNIDSLEYKVRCVYVSETDEFTTGYYDVKYIISEKVILLEDNNIYGNVSKVGDLDDISSHLIVMQYNNHWHWLPLN